MTWMISQRARVTARCVLLVMSAWTMLLAGCAGPGPRLFPACPTRVETRPDGAESRSYDLNSDGVLDYGEELDATGRIVKLVYLQSTAGQSCGEVDLRQIPADQRRDLLIILDSVPYDVVAGAQIRGRLRFFARPSRVIAPFPVMTDPSLVDFFGQTPGIAVESEYFDGSRMTSPYGLYLNGGVAIWEANVDYRLSHQAHASAYLDEYAWFDHELREIQDLVMSGDRRCTIGYCVGTSALGAYRGMSGHQYAVARADRLCQQIMYETRGRMRITLMSDHGHDFYDSTRIALADELRKLGYRVGDRLERPGDAVVPEFAMVSCAAIYTRDAARLAQDAVGIEGIELAVCRDGDDAMTVLSKGGLARVTRRDGKYRYDAASGDPLRIMPLLASKAAREFVNDDGWVDDAVWTKLADAGDYVDPLDRLWRALHDQFQHKPDVLLSVEPGYHCGSPFQTSVRNLIGVHGSMRPASTFGFAASTAGELPEVVRMRDLRNAMRQAGVALPDVAR